MEEEFVPGKSKAKYAAVAAAAVFFLLILPGVVLAIASNMTGVELAVLSDDSPPPEHQIVARRNAPPGLSLWLRIPEDTSDKDLKSIIHHIVETRDGNPEFLTFYFDKVNPETKMPKRPSTDESDQTFEWTLTRGIRRLK